MIDCDFGAKDETHEQRRLRYEREIEGNATLRKLVIILRQRGHQPDCGRNSFGGTLNFTLSDPWCSGRVHVAARTGIADDGSIREPVYLWAYDDSGGGLSLGSIDNRTIDLIAFATALEGLLDESSAAYERRIRTKEFAEMVGRRDTTDE